MPYDKQVLDEEEKDTELYLVHQISLLGGLSYKLANTGRRGAPDRLVILPSRVAFVEVKAEGVPPEAHQTREIDRLKALGHTALVVETRAEVDALMQLPPISMSRELYKLKQELIAVHGELSQLKRFRR